MILTYKYRLKDAHAARHLQRHAWAINQVWNFCVATQRSTQRRRRDGAISWWLSKFDLQALTKGTSKDLNIHAQSIQCVCEQFVKSRDLHKKCPRFRKSSGSKRALGWIPFQQQSRKVAGNAVMYLGHTYRFFGEKRRPLPEIVKGGCFVEDARGRWWVCFHVEVDALPTATGSAIGVDLGLKTLATLSNGEKIENPRAYRRLEEKLAIAQRARNARRAKALATKIANKRRDHLHKESAKIARAYRFVAVGDVSSSQLAKTRMAKSVHDASWSTFRNFLRYKVSRHGGTFLEVDERGSTQTCSSCGMLPPERPKGIAGLGMREWRCSACGTNHDRDVNAAQNILALGLSAQPLVEESRVPFLGT